ncbi:MAG: hypothetical protein E6Q88_07210 [Lysobacteraceae bacterium]|nr:MAG: hypothetical protein E6Q88_07210 [Xanthomonadaceae bacterium]
MLQIDPAQVMRWSDADVATRWVHLFPPHDGSDEAHHRKRLHLLSNAERLQTIRHRLGSLSWFMRCLAEPIARHTNREDGCTGRFWGGRFKAQMLCDEQSLLTAMTYVDLNPIRAGIARSLDESRHTAIKRRLACVKRDRNLLSQRIKPVAGSIDGEAGITTADYILMPGASWVGCWRHVSV